MDDRGNIKYFGDAEKALEAGYKTLLDDTEAKMLEKIEKKKRHKVLAEMRTITTHTKECTNHKYKTLVKGVRWQCRICGQYSGTPEIIEGDKI